MSLIRVIELDGSVTETVVEDVKIDQPKLTDAEILDVKLTAIAKKIGVDLDAAISAAEAAKVG